MTKNITLRMDEQLLKDVKHIAIEHDMSVSAWITKVVEKASKRDPGYEEAKDFALKMMEQAPAYGGKIPNRDEMHDR
jgi:hypothetical protein